MDAEHDTDEWVADERRLRLIKWLLAREGAYYRWGAKGQELPADAWLALELEPPKCRELYDCSGLVTSAMHAMGLHDWRLTHNAARLFDVLETIPAAHAAPGDLVFYGQPGQVSHVMFAWDHGRVYGACQGNASTLTLATAAKDGSKVRTRDRVKYRPDVRGYRRFPFPALELSHATS